jgi:hypothetical protein
VDQVFGERLHVTTANATSSDNEFPNDDLFPDVDDLFGDLSMGDNTDDDAPAAAAQVAPYVTLFSRCWILLEFLVLVFGVDTICLSFLDAIYLSTLLRD